MPTRKAKSNIRTFSLTGLLLLSVFSFVYINSVDLESLVTPQETIMVEEIDEPAEEVLPDIHLIKKIMHKALEFVTLTLPAKI